MAPAVVFSPQSYLFVPGNRRERFKKALSSGADAVIVDLEDAVEPDAKDAARENVSAWVSREHRTLVRINGRGTQWFDQDAKLGALEGVAGIVVPKAESLQDIVDVVARARRRVPIFPLIETAKGMWSVMEIARAPCVARLMFGTLDFIADMGTDDPGQALNPYRTQLALASRVAGVDAPVDGVTPDIDDAGRLEEETRNGMRHGFSAKLCIHPKQIETVHTCFGPATHEVDWARRIVEAVSRAAGKVVTVDGKMVDRPVVLRARSVLARATHRQQTSTGLA